MARLSENFQIKRRCRRFSRQRSSDNFEIGGVPVIFRVFKVAPRQGVGQETLNTLKFVWVSDSFKVFRAASRPVVGHETLKTLKCVGATTFSEFSKLHPAYKTLTPNTLKFVGGHRFQIFQSCTPWGNEPAPQAWELPFPSTN